MHTWANSLDGWVGIFFAAKDELLLHTCPVEEGEPYGDFVNFPESHDTVWQREYARKYGVDFDYFPRGRIIYNKNADTYKLFYDSCARLEANDLLSRYQQGQCEVYLDEHYQCYKCNKEYIK